MSVQVRSIWLRVQPAGRARPRAMSRGDIHTVNLPGRVDMKKEWCEEGDSNPYTIAGVRT